MEKSLLALDRFMPFVVGSAVFALLLVMIFKALQETSLFRGKVATAIVSACVALLSVIGMFRFLGARDETHNVSEKIGGDGTNLDMVLLPYAVLGIAIILLAIYLFASKLLGSDKPKKPLHNAERRAESAFQLDLGKGDRSAEEHLGKALKEMAMTQNKSRSPKLTNRLLRERVDQSDTSKETKSNRIKQ